MKLNKCNKINDNHIYPIKEMYFKGDSIKKIADTFGYKYSFMENYLSSKATKIYIHEGIEYRRCSVCKAYKQLDKYSESGSYLGVKLYRSECKHCRNLVARNKRRIKKNIEEISNRIN